MKRLTGNIVGLTLMLFILASPIANGKADYSLMLIGGGLEFCTSQSIRECTKPLKLSSEHHVDYAYFIDESRIAQLQKTIWSPARIIEKNQLVEAVKQAHSRTKGVLTRRQLLTALRDAEIPVKDKKMRGSDLLQSLQDVEFHTMLDILQMGNIEHNLLSTNEHRKIKVDIKNSKSHFSLKVLRAFVHQSKTLTSKKRPNIVIVTAANRDQFEPVDLYTQLFDELGANVTWLPADLALFAAIEANSNNKEAEACDKLDDYRQSLLQLYARQRIFPTLTEYQRDICKNPERLSDMLANAQGVYFVEGDAFHLKNTFINDYPMARKIINDIQQRMLKAELVVAADQEAAMAFSGGQSSVSKPAMMLDGDSHNALLYGAFQTTSPLKQCEKIKNCPRKYKEGQTTYLADGGLGLFPFGVVDTRFSERGRQGRLIQLVAQSKSVMGYGIDERTALMIGIDDSRDIPLRMEVIGENGVSIFDLSEVEQDKGFENSILSVRSHYLTDEDKLFFRNNKIIISFADWKYSGNSRSRPVIKSGSAFKNDNYRRTINILCATGADSATMKHSVLGTGHTLYVTKSRTSISLAGKKNVAGNDYSFCSYRDYYLDINPI